MKHVLICGAGAIGLCSALYLRERGFEVAVIERDSAGADGCSFGNAGMVVPSHFTPLAAPGAIGLGLRWLLDPGSPFYIRPRFDPALAAWIVQFMRAANREHVNRAGPILRDLLIASRELYEQLADSCDNAFGLTKRGMMMLSRTRAPSSKKKLVRRGARATSTASRCPNPAQMPRLCSVLSEAHVAVTPMGSSLRIGGTMEFAGLDRAVSVRRTQTIAAAAAQYFPALRAQDIAQVRPWPGCVRARPTAYLTSVDLRHTRTCAWPPGTQCSGSASRRSPGGW
jgi:glycine/D-amino acid oxidase-like deaminating enzyme